MCYFSQNMIPTRRSADPTVSTTDARSPSVRFAGTRALTCRHPIGPGASPGVDAQFTLNHTPPLLVPIYDANPIGVQVFFRARLNTLRPYYAVS